MALTDGYGDGVNDVFFPGITAQDTKESVQHIHQQPLSGSQGSPKSYSPFEDSIEYHDSFA